MFNNNYTDKLINFINKSPSCFHAIKNIETILIANGFIKLRESEKWNLKPNGKYYVTKSFSSIVAFKVPKGSFNGFQITASHSDFPCLKIKSEPEIVVSSNYTKLNVEKYGGLILNTWLDRPLSIAGKVIIKTNEGIKTKLINIDRDLVLIPNLAIHFNRTINDGYSYNPRIDMLPIFSEATLEKNFIKTIANEAKVDYENILGTDLFLYNRSIGSVWGENKEFFSSPRIDNLECTFLTLTGFLKGTNSQNITVYSVFDNEEVGSCSKQGAGSTFLKDTLKRINYSLGGSLEDYFRLIASSFLISADNAHAVHPNFTEKSDESNKPYMNKGIAIKYNASQKYTTDAFSEAVFKEICNKAKVPYQTYSSRSDIVGGSTLGNILSSQVSVNSVDIGLAQLAMHSSYETAGVRDIEYMVNAMEEFFNCTITYSED